MSFALSSAAAASVARVSSKATLRGRSLRAARSKATRPVRAMAVKAEVNQLKDGDKKGLVDSVETFIFDCDGVIWKGDSLIEGVPETIAMLREMGKRPSSSPTTPPSPARATSRSSSAWGSRSPPRRSFPPPSPPPRTSSPSTSPRTRRCTSSARSASWRNSTAWASSTSAARRMATRR